MAKAPKARLSTSPDAGMSIAVAALNFLAADVPRLERFLSITGLGPNNLRDAAADAGFCASVLDYVLSDEPLLLSFAEAEGLHPEQVARAFRVLGGSPARYES
jgi:hypothetical protein